MPKERPTKTKKADLKPLRARRPFSSRRLTIFILVFAAVGGYVLWRSFAAPVPPSLYLTPASGSYGINTSFTVQIRENSGTVNVNSVQANLTYPANLVDFVSMDATGSAFSVVAQNTGGSGSIAFGGGVGCATTCAPVSGDQLVATIHFKTKITGGPAAVVFAGGTGLADSTTNTNILPSLANTAGGTYIIDVTPPSVSITSPVASASLAGGSVVNVSVSASDAASLVSRVDVYVDGVLSGNMTTSPYVYAWQTAGLGLGAHTIQAKALDSSGNLGSSPVVSVTLADQTLPSTPVNFRYTGTTSTSVALAWNASTDNIAVTAYKIKRGGTLIATLTPPALSYNDSGLAAGTAYSYSIQAFDAAGNASATTSLTVTTASQKIGDFNGDNKVDFLDLSIFVNSYHVDAKGDLNGDHITDFLDLSIFVNNFSK